jgi:predicted RNA-binding protein with PIN domain
MKVFILDANNIIHKESTLKKLFETSPNGATTGFLHLIEQYSSRYPSYKFHIFFDSIQQLLPKFSSITLYSSSNNEDADTLIRKYLEKATLNPNFVVVSSDLEVQSSARRFNIKTLSSKDFLALLTATLPNANATTTSNKKSSVGIGEKPNRITKREMNEFKELFSTKS